MRKKGRGVVREDHLETVGTITERLILALK